MLTGIPSRVCQSIHADASDTNRVHFFSLGVVCHKERLCHYNLCDSLFGGRHHASWVRCYRYHVVGMGLPMICPCSMQCSWYHHVSLSWVSLRDTFTCEDSHVKRDMTNVIGPSAFKYYA